MTPKLTLYSRRDCCLCAEMKAVIERVAAQIAVDLNVIDIDASVELQGQFGSQVPVLFIDGRKAFKYRVTATDLKKQLAQGRGSLWARLGRGFGKELP